jgi:hypothetical protein
LIAEVWLFFNSDAPVSSRGVTDDVGRSLGVDGAGNVLVAGYVSDIVDFNPDPSATYYLGAPGGRRNGFLLRLGQS